MIFLNYLLWNDAISQWQESEVKEMEISKQISLNTETHHHKTEEWLLNKINI